MSGIPQHREAVETLLADLQARVDAEAYPRTVVHIDAGPGAAQTRRGSAHYAARRFLVHTNVHGVTKGQCELLLDRVMGLENLRPVVDGRRCDPLAVFASRGPSNDTDLADRDVWTASVVWQLLSYAA